eukprot:6517043-Heterocapsa_arctica.AAC.1
MPTLLQRPVSLFRLVVVFNGAVNRHRPRAHGCPPGAVGSELLSSRPPAHLVVSAVLHYVWTVVRPITELVPD